MRRLHQVVDSVDEVAQVPPQAVKLPDEQRIALTERLEAGLKSGPVVALPGGLILIEVPCRDAGGDERIALQVEDLGAVRLGDAHVADEHPASCHLYGRLCDAAVRRVSGDKPNHIICH